MSNWLSLMFCGIFHIYITAYLLYTPQRAVRVAWPPSDHLILETLLSRLSTHTAAAISLHSRPSNTAREKGPWMSDINALVYCMYLNISNWRVWYLWWLQDPYNTLSHSPSHGTIRNMKKSLSGVKCESEIKHWKKQQQQQAKIGQTMKGEVFLKNPLAE